MPNLGAIPITQISQRDIREALAPIWNTKGETAEKALQRLGIVFQHAAALGLDADLQATAKAKALLGAQPRIRQNVPAMRWQDVPAFYASLDDGTITHLALRPLILTAARSGEVRMIHVSELDGDVWMIPAGRMKAGVEHRVPLSLEARRVIEVALPFLSGVSAHGTDGRD